MKEVWESGQKFTTAWPSVSSHIHPIRWSSDKQNYFRDNCLVHFIIKQIGGTVSRDVSLCLRNIKIVIQVKMLFTWSLWNWANYQIFWNWEFQKPQQGYFSKLLSSYLYIFQCIASPILQRPTCLYLQRQSNLTGS